MSIESHPPSPEHEAKPDRPAFDLEQLEPADIIRLYAALESAREKEYELRGYGYGTGSEFDNLIEVHYYPCLLNLPDSNIEKARAVFFLMASHNDEWVRVMGAELASSLLRHELSRDYQTRQKVIDAWVRLLRDETGEVGNAAGVAMYQAINSDWLSPDIASYLLAQMRDLP